MTVFHAVMIEWGPAVALVFGPWVAFAIWCRR
jgi:hypothetical protein